MQAASETIKFHAKMIRSRILSSKITHIRNFGTIVNIDLPNSSLGYPYFAVHHYKKNVGDFVRVGEIIAEIELDMTSIDFHSQHTGVITKFLFEEGDTIKDGSPFLEMDTDAKAPTNNDTSKTVDS